MRLGEIANFVHPNLKKCRGCDKNFPVDTYYLRPDRRTGKSYRVGKCTNCQREQEAHRRLQILYKLSMKEYAKILKKQDYLCGICRTDKSPKAKLKFRPFHVDHNHKTGVVRGLLCHKCNALLGMAGDQIDVLESAISYIRRSLR